MGKGSAPSAPDPYQTAQAQEQFGTQAAAYNANLNQVNQVGPTGSTTYAQTGTDPVTGAPKFTSTTQLSAPEQALLSGQQRLSGQAQGLAGEQAGNVGNAVSGWGLPSEAENGQFGAQARQAAYGAETATMDPYWQQQQESMDASLRNAGATPGTPAYDNAMRSFQANRSSAYGQAENQAFGQGLSAQGQEISDVNQAQGGQIANFLSLATGSPGATSTGASGNSTTGASTSAPDIMQAFQNQYQGQLAGYNSNVASTNADIGAGVGLAAVAAMMY